MSAHIKKYIYNEAKIIASYLDMILLTMQMKENIFLKIPTNWNCCVEQ